MIQFLFYIFPEQSGREGDWDLMKSYQPFDFTSLLFYINYLTNLENIKITLHLYNFPTKNVVSVRRNFIQRIFRFLHTSVHNIIIALNTSNGSLLLQTLFFSVFSTFILSILFHSVTFHAKKA
jgi:hypothetical protein